MKAVPLEQMESVMLSDNGFTKIFKVRGDIDLFLSKAVDEETNKHYFVATIREIPELNAHGVQFPFEFETESERDEAYNLYDIVQARDFVEFSIEFIKEKDEFKKQEAEKIKLQESEQQKELPSNTDEP